MSAITLTEHERRVLSYLDQRGPSHRQWVVRDLAADQDRHIGPQAAAMIMGSWCRRLSKQGMVRTLHKPHRLSTRGGGSKTLHFYEHHEITSAGKAMLRGDTGHAATIVQQDGGK